MLGLLLHPHKRHPLLQFSLKYKLLRMIYQTLYALVSAYVPSFISCLFTTEAVWKEPFIYILFIQPETSLLPALPLCPSPHLIPCRCTMPTPMLTYLSDFTHIRYFFFWKPFCDLHSCLFYTDLYAAFQAPSIQTEQEPSQCKGSFACLVPSWMLPE